MNARRRLLWLGLADAAAAIALAQLDAPVWLRAPFGLAMVTFVPGNALLELLDPGRRVGGVERAVLALGSSIATALVAGLLLSASPAGLGAATWSAGLGLVSVLGSLLALHAIRGPEPADARHFALPRGWRGQIARSGALFAVMAVLALAMTAAAATGTLGSEQAVEQGRASVLQLWAVPGGGGEVEVSVENPTDAPVKCVLIVRQGQVVIAEESLLLEPGDAFSLRVSPAANASIMFPLEALLTDSAHTETLRRVTVWPAANTGWTSQAADPEG